VVVNYWIFIQNIVFSKTIKTMGTQRDFDGPFGHGISDMGFFCANHWNAMGIQLDNQQKKSLQ